MTEWRVYSTGPGRLPGISHFAGTIMEDQRPKKGGRVLGLCGRLALALSVSPPLLSVIPCCVEGAEIDFDFLIDVCRALLTPLTGILTVAMVLGALSAVYGRSAAGAVAAGLCLGWLLAALIIVGLVLWILVQLAPLAI
jgi:hypothetical protein